MGSGNSGLKAQSLQDQLKIQQTKQVKSAKYPPFTENEVYNLSRKFRNLDKSVRQSITLQEFKGLLEIKMHFFSARIYDLIEQDLAKSNLTLINFDRFMKYLTVFHPQTDVDIKKEYMFQIYDINGDGMITKEDLTQAFKLLFMGGKRENRNHNGRPKIFQTNFMNENYVIRLGKDIMNIVDLDKSDSIELDEFFTIITDNDVMFRMNIVF